MAIDTRQKRQNAAQVGCPMPVSVLPSGASSQAVRYQIAWSYSNASAPPTPPEPLPFWLTNNRGPNFWQTHDVPHYM